MSSRILAMLWVAMIVGAIVPLRAAEEASDESTSPSTRETDVSADDQRLPVPDPVAQDEAMKLVKDVFADEYAKTAPAARRALGKLLLDKAAEATHRNEEYVLLRESADVSASAGDVVTAVRAVEQFASTYDVDELDAIATAVQTVARQPTFAPADVNALLTQGLQALELAVVDDRYVVAVAKLAPALESSAGKTRDLTLAAAAKTRCADVRDLQKRFAGVQAAQQTLATTPDDPAAQLVVGRFFCFSKGDWTEGLPHLAASSDETLKNLAKLELAFPTDPKEAVKLADAWWALGETSEPRTKAIIQDRALMWYRTTVRDVSGLEGERVKKRLRDNGHSDQPAPRKVVYTFDQKADLDAWQLHGNFKLGGRGGLEAINGKPRSFAISRATYGYPIHVEIAAATGRHGNRDILPSLLTDSEAGGFRLVLGGSKNRASWVSFFGRRIDLLHVPLKVERMYRITLTIDENRNAIARVDSRVVFQDKVPDNIELKGHIVLSGGIGHVLFRRVTIEAPQIAP